MRRRRRTRVPALICHEARALIAGRRRHGARCRSRRCSRGRAGRALAAGEILVAIRLPPVAAALGRRPICASRRGARWTSPSPARRRGCGSATTAPSREARIVLASVGADADPRARRPSASSSASRPTRALFEEAGRLAAQRCAPDLRHARLGRLSPHAGRRADGARARRLLPAARSWRSRSHEDAAHLHRQRRGAHACSPTRATRCSSCCAIGSA